MSDPSKIAGASADDGILALVDLLFQSLMDEQPWARFLDAARRVFQSRYVTIILTPNAARRPGMLLTPGADMEVTRKYRDSIFRHDPFTGLPEGVVTHYRDFVADTGRQDRDFRDFIRDSGDEILGVDLHEEGDFELRLRITRGQDEPPFGKAEVQRLQAIVPHLRTAGRLFDRIAAGQIERKIYSTAIEKLAVGVIILNRSGAILSMNATADMILGEGDGIARSNGRILLSDRADARQLDSLIAAVGNENADADISVTLRIERSRSAGDLCLSAARANAPSYVSDSGGPATVLYITDPSRGPRVAKDQLRTLLNLTASEASIAAAMAEGLALPDIAAELGISLNTVRAHIRSIYSKTGVNRQSRLVQLVHRSLAGLSAPAG